MYFFAQRSRIVTLILLFALYICTEAFRFNVPTRNLDRYAIKSKKVLSSSFSLKYKTFDEFLESIPEPVLVDFYAEWCGPCKMMQPVLEDVASRLENVAKVAKVDTDKSPRLGSRYEVEALPTLILFHEGKVLERFIGYRTADVLEAEIRKQTKPMSQSTLNVLVFIAVSVCVSSLRLLPMKMISDGRKPFIAGNWKLNPTTVKAASTLAADVARLTQGVAGDKVET
eukprot:gene33578-43395_t